VGQDQAFELVVVPHGQQRDDRSAVPCDDDQFLFALLEEGAELGLGLLRPRRSSKLYLLSTDDQAIPLLDSDRQDVHPAVLPVDLVKGPEPVVGAKSQLPLRFEKGGPPQWLPVPGFGIRLEQQLLFERLVASFSGAGGGGGA
jgi:hypothetical protein